MGFELPNGKTARNIQEQVAFLTEKVKELFAAVSDLGFKVVKVDVLPEEGASRTIYLVPSSDPETANMYDEYIWTEDGWEKIGSTDIDLSNYVDLTSNQTIGGNKSFSGVVSFIGGANFNGPIKTSFYPETSNSYDLGLSSYTWKDLYLSGQLNIGENSLRIESDDNLGIYTGTGRRIKIAPSAIVFNARPDASTDNSLDLGRTSVRWRDAYIAGELKDGTNSATVADIAALITYAKAQGWIS